MFNQTGYIVFSGVRRAKGVQGLRVIVQSSKPPQFVEGRIEAFIQKMEVSFSLTSLFYNLVDLPTLRFSHVQSEWAVCQWTQTLITVQWQNSNIYFFLNCLEKTIVSRNISILAFTQCADNIPGGCYSSHQKNLQVDVKIGYF